MAPEGSFKQWEEFLWDKYNAVAVPALNTDCQIMSVFIKRPAKGLHISFSSSPEVVVKVANAWSIKLDGDKSTMDCKQLYKAFEAQVSKGSDFEADDFLPFSYQDLGDIEQVVKNSTSLGAFLDAGVSGAGKVKAELETSKTLTVTAKGVFSHKFERVMLEKAIKGGRWQPDMPLITSEFKHKSGVIWVINEVFYAESIEISSHHGVSAKAEVAAMPGVPGGLGVGADASGNTDSQLSIHGGAADKTPRPFAFKVLAFKVTSDAGSGGDHFEPKREQTGRVLPRSSGPGHPSKPQNIHPEVGRDRAKAAPAAKRRSKEATLRSKEVVKMSNLFDSISLEEPEGHGSVEAYDIAKLPIIFSAPAKEPEKGHRAGSQAIKKGHAG